jgi:hypothetical protein
VRLRLQNPASRRGRRNPTKTVWYVLGAATGYLATKLAFAYAAYRVARSQPTTCPNCGDTFVAEPLPQIFVSAKTVPPRGPSHRA